jgi:uncharacterized membrane protein YsdA (DUF1294 family)
MNYSRRKRAVLGRELNGRSRDRNGLRAKGSAGFVLGCLLVITGLLVMPVIAGQRRGVDSRWAGAYAMVISAVTYWAYARDKRRAREGEWRVSEARLHLLELLGGWPGAFMAQRILRHKCSKGTYQAIFWLIVLLYQFLAFDSLRNWQFSSVALNRLEPVVQQRR